jgi:hypothetical protein
MRIYKEFDAKNYGEYDFFVKEPDKAINLLTENGFRVGIGGEPERITIDTDGVFAKEDFINRARKLIEEY